MLIRVEQRHIDEGRASSPTSCAVALAIKDALPIATSIGVGSADVWIGTEPFQYIDLPEHVRAAIDAYDDGLDVEPFEFELELNNA